MEDTQVGDIQEPPIKYLYNGKIVPQAGIDDAAKQSNLDVNTYIKKAGISVISDNYSYNGKTIPAEGVLDAANQSNLDFNTYIRKAGIKPIGDAQSVFDGQRPSNIKPAGFAANINMGEAQKPLSINLHPAPEQTEQQPEAPSIENNFGFNHTAQQNVVDNTANVAPTQALEKVDFDVNHVQRVKQQEAYTNQAIDNATSKALKLKGINAQPGSVQYNQQRNEFVKQVQNGDATVNTKNGEAGLERTTGFLENIENGWNEATTGADEADDFANKMTAQERVDYLNKKQSEQKPSPYIGEKPNLLGSTGHLIGSSVPFLAKAGAGAVIGAGAVAAAPESMGASLSGLPTALSIALTAGDMTNQGIQQEVSRRFYILKKEFPNRSDVENMEEAGKGALIGGLGGFIENVALMGTGIKTPILSESKSLIGQTVNKIINSGVHLGTVSAGITAAEQEIGNLQGIKTSQSDILKNSLESFKEGATTGAALTAIMHFPQMPKILKSAFKDAIVRNENPQTVANVLQANENVGNIPQGTTQKVTADLNGYREALGKIPDGLSTEAQSSIAGLIQKKNNLIEEAKTKDDSFKDFYKQKTDAIDQQIADIQRTGKPFEHEIDEATGKPYEQPTYDEVAQQRVQDLAKKISKNADISDPQSIQTQQNFPEQLKAELQNIADVEKKNNEGKENPNTEVADNAENFIKKNLNKTEEPPAKNEVEPAPDNVSRETKEVSNEPLKDVESTTKALDEVQNKNPSLWDRIKNIFNNAVSKTKEYLNKAKGTQFEELAKVLAPYLNNVRTSEINNLKGVLGERIGGQLQRLHILVNSGKGDLQTFFHEALHHITFDKISQFLNGNHENLKSHEIDAIDNLNRIFNESKQKLKAKGIKVDDAKVGYYGFTNLHEFVSETFTNPEFQRLLKELPSEGKSPTIFNQFINAIAKLIGVKDPTIIDDIFHHTEKLLGDKKSESQSISELYHQAKADGGNPGLVKAVEDLLKPKTENQPKTSSTEKTRQEKINDLVDRIHILDKQPKNAKGRINEINEIKLQANELGLTYDDKRVAGLFNKNGNKVRKKTGGNNAIIEDYVPLSKRDENTKGFVGTIVEAANRDGVDPSDYFPTVKDADGRRMTKSQIKKAISDVQNDKPTAGAQSLLDAVDDFHKRGDVDVSTPTVPQTGAITPEEYLANFKEPITKEGIQEIQDKVGEKQFDEIYEELKNQINETGTSNAGDQPNAGETGSGNAPEAGNGIKRIKEAEEGLARAKSDHDRATADLSNAEKKLSEKQSKQGDLLNPEKNIVQQDAFANDANVVKDALEPLRTKVKETKDAFDKAKTELENANKGIQPELKLNKSEERVFKDQIKKSDADKIIEDEGLTADNINDYKHLFNGFPYTPEDLKNIKNSFNEKRPTSEPAADGQENTGRTGDKKTGDEIKAAETPDAKGTADKSSGSPEGGSPNAQMEKVAFARSNSYDSYKLLHPEESVEDYNKLRNSDVEIPTGDLRRLSKEYVKGQNNESFAQQKFYEEIAGSKPADTGRIPVSPIVGKAKELSKIILDVANSINQKISFLKPGRKAAGTYNSGNAGIKIKFNGDLDVTAHEIGHSIDDHFGLLKDLVKQPDLEIEAELNKFSPYGSKPPKGHPDPGKYTRGEGFAEWLRSYIVNPNEAIKQAPKLYDLYKSKVSEAYQKAMTDFSNDVRTWAGSTGRDMTLSNIEWEPEKAKGLIKQVLSKKGNDMFSISFADKLAANWVNPMKAFEKAFDYAKGIKGLDQVLPENDPAILARLFLSIDRKFGEFLDHGLRDSKDQLIKNKDGNPITFKWLIEPLDNTDMASIKREMQDVTAYMIAERTVELGNRFKRDEILTGIGGGIYKDVQVAKKTLDEFNNGDPTRLERIKEAASRYREFADSNLKYMVDKGRLSKEAYDEIKKNNLQYVALHRIMEAEPETEIQVFKGGSKSIASVSQPVQSIKGSTKKISNPYTSLLDSMYKSLKESERNDVLRAFRDMLVNNRGMYEGDPKKLAEVGVLAKSGDKNTITIFVDGKPEKWAFQKDVYEALKGLDKEGYRFPKIATLPARLLRNMTTRFPTFAARNVWRDLQDRLIKSNEHSGVKDLFGNKEHWRDVARKGGLNSGYYVRDKAHYYGLMEQAMDEISKNQKTIFVDPIKIKSLWHGYEHVLESSETVNRVAEYRAAFRNGKKKGMDDYNAGLYAAFKSRDLMDFAVAGHYMKILNQIIPFSNAAVQAVRSSAVRLQENPVGFFARMALYSMIPKVALWWWNHRDDETAKQYEQLPYYQRDLFYNFKIGDNKWVSAPAPYELSITGAGIDRALSYYISGNKESFSGYAGDMFKSISPVDESVIFGPYQSVAGAMANKDIFRGKHIISPDEEGLNLALRHTETASWLSQQIQKVAGIDARKLDYIIRSQFSYVGNEGLKLTDKVAKMAGANIQTNRNDFDITDLGFFKRSPAYNAPVVQDMMEFAKEWRLDRSREYKEFKGLAAKYFDTDDDSKKEEYSKQMIDLAQNLLDTWKAQGIDEKIKAKDQKKRLQNKK
jgi:hypothetical protein